MLDGDDQPHSVHPLDVLIPDPSGRPPMCDEAMFGQLMREMVADAAPRLFAVLEVYGDRVDVRIAGWGMGVRRRSARRQR